MCIYYYDAFLLLTFLKIAIQGNGWYFFAWDFKGLSQSVAKHITYIKKFKLYVLDIHKVCVECFIFMKLEVIS